MNSMTFLRARDLSVLTRAVRVKALSRATPSALLAVLLAAPGCLSVAHAQRVPFGTPWTLYRYGQVGQETTVDSANAPTLQFDAGRVLGSGVCNTYSAGYLARGRDLKIGALTATRRTCPNPLEAYFLKALPQVTRFQVTGDFLVLLTGDRETLVFRRAE